MGDQRVRGEQSANSASDDNNVRAACAASSSLGPNAQTNAFGSFAAFQAILPCEKHQAPAPTTRTGPKAIAGGVSNARAPRRSTQASRRLAAFALLLALSVHGRTPAQAGDYPDHTVKIVVPFPAGGTADAIPRIVAELAFTQMGPAGGHREPHGRGRKHRRRTGLSFAARRLHAAVVTAAATRDQSEPVSEARVRSDEVRTDHGDGAGAERADRQSEQRQGIEREPS